MCSEISCIAILENPSQMSRQLEKTLLQQTIDTTQANWTRKTLGPIDERTDFLGCMNQYYFFSQMQFIGSKIHKLP